MENCKKNHICIAKYNMINVLKVWEWIKKKKKKLLDC